MRNVLGQQYWYDARKMDDIDKFITECIKSFINKYGYEPTLLTAQQELLDTIHDRSDIDMTVEKVQRKHIRLYDVVLVRQPRISSIYRTPMKMSMRR